MLGRWVMREIPVRFGLGEAVSGGGSGSRGYFAALGRLDRQAEQYRRAIDLVSRVMDLRALGCADGSAWAAWDSDAASLIDELGGDEQ